MIRLNTGETELEFTQMDQTSAAEDAYRQIRKLIITGALRSGQVISEQDLVRQLNIGRTPVREAIQRLSAQHVIEVFPRRGLAVAKLGIEDVQSIFEARETIEAKIAELAAVRRTDDEAQAVVALGEKIGSIANREDFRLFLDLDQQLHHLIATAARNPFLSESADHLLMLSDWIWHQYFQLRGPRQAAYFTHESIIRAVVSQDIKGAGSAMSSHIQQSREFLHRAM